VTLAMGCSDAALRCAPRYPSADVLTPAPAACRNLMYRSGASSHVPIPDQKRDSPTRTASAAAGRLVAARITISVHSERFWIQITLHSLSPEPEVPGSSGFCVCVAVVRVACDERCRL
jgi:hypothetical protein